MKNILDYKKDFPIFANNPELVYLDNAVTSQKPQVVIDAVSDFYKKQNANTHRGIYALSQTATDLFESVRIKVQKFVKATDPNEIVFTSGTTESINLIAQGYGNRYLKKGDIVVLSEMEHHSNIVPWIRLTEEKNIKLAYIPVNEEGVLEYKNFDVDYRKVKLISLTHVSNVLGTINPIAEIVSHFKQNGANAKVAIDAAQSIPHIPINVQALGCDFLAFSSHKMLGPSGVGVLWARKELLENMDPLLVGSHMIQKVTKDNATWADIPDKFEAGTRNIEGVIGLGAAIDYIQNLGFDNIKKYEEMLTKYALDRLATQKNVRVFGSKTSTTRLGVFSFAVGNVHPHDVAEILNRENVAVRSGHHCAQVLMESLGVAATARASLYFYNTEEDIDKLIHGIETVKDTFKQ